MAPGCVSFDWRSHNEDWKWLQSHTCEYTMQGQANSHLLHGRSCQSDNEIWAKCTLHNHPTFWHHRTVLAAGRTSQKKGQSTLGQFTISAGILSTSAMIGPTILLTLSLIGVVADLILNWQSLHSGCTWPPCSASYTMILQCCVEIYKEWGYWFTVQSTQKHHCNISATLLWN